MVQENSINNKIIIICGATASGKSALALECAKLLDSEIIYADSMDVYKTLDIGTAKPTEEEKEGIVHHLIDVCDSANEFSVSQYKALAEPIIKNLLEKGKTPIITAIIIPIIKGLALVEIAIKSPSFTINQMKG